MIEHLTRLARIVHALRQGQTVTSGPFTEDHRGGKRITQEWFFVGKWRVSREDELMHRVRTEFAREGRDSTVADTSDPTDWSPQDIMQASASWNEEELKALPALPEPGTDHVIDMIMALADGDWHPFMGTTIRMKPDDTDDECPWTFEREGGLTGPLRPLQHVLGELVFVKPRG